jgi:vacuolar-type H+-ATPase subunit H
VPAGERTCGVDEAAEEGALVSDAIEKIGRAELKAEESLRDGRAEAKRLVAAAHEESERMLDVMRKEARAEEKALIENARAGAEGDAKGILGESRTGVERVRSGAGGKVEAGVKKVLDAITAAA